jgi:hypothetical protein
LAQRGASPSQRGSALFWPVGVLNVYGVSSLEYYNVIQKLTNNRIFRWGSGSVEEHLTRVPPIERIDYKRNDVREASLEQKLDHIAQYQTLFLLAHLQPPHFPASFDKNCQEILAKRKTATSSSKPEYLNDLRCTNQQLIRVIDKILSRDPQAIIVLHSDHGTSYNVDWSWPLEQWPRKAFEERCSILMALRLPADCRQSLYPSLSPVNIFRVTFACLEGRLPEILGMFPILLRMRTTRDLVRSTNTRVHPNVVQPHLIEAHRSVPHAHGNGGMSRISPGKTKGPKDGARFQEAPIECMSNVPGKYNPQISCSFTTRRPQDPALGTPGPPLRRSQCRCNGASLTSSSIWD